MRVKKVILKDFKRFDNLTIDLGENPRKIIALVGPNGCGKSSIFDAFEEILKSYKSGRNQQSGSFFSKLCFSIIPEKKSETYSKNNSIKIIKEDNTSGFNNKSFYIRSCYRFIPILNVTNIKKQPDILADSNRPGSSIDLDERLRENYERLLGLAWREYQYGSKSGPEMREELVGRINGILKEILDIRISDLGDVIAGKGQLFFEKEGSKDFPYTNLSSGEKEVVDIIIDLIVKIPEYDETVYCIDEPELHLNTAIQRKLLVEINKLIPDNCQLWVATHSIGFLRALQKDLGDRAQVLDFSERDYFNSVQTITPIKTARKNWQRIFQTALEDMTGLMAPEKIIYCEGRPDPSSTGDEQGLDAEIYNKIFGEEFQNTLFISSGGGGAINKSSSLALKILSKAFMDVELYLLKDRDNLTFTERQTFLSRDPYNRMLEKTEIENYIFDDEILKIFCTSKTLSFDQTQYRALVTDIKYQDFKNGQTLQKLQNLCGARGPIKDFKIELANFITPETNVYNELKRCIF